MSIAAGAPQQTGSWVSGGAGADCRQSPHWVPSATEDEVTVLWFPHLS